MRRAMPEDDSQRRNGDASRRNGDSPRGEGDYQRRDGDASMRNGDYQPRNGDYQRRDGDASRRNGDSPRREGDYQRRDGDASMRNGDYQPRNGDYQRRDGDASRRNGDSPRREGDYQRRDGDASRRFVKSDAGRRPEGNAAFKCRFCGLSYNYKSTLDAHERVHDVDAPYKCTKCGDSFRFQSELQNHMLGHNSKKSYKCKCGRGFMNYADLLNHRHFDEEPLGSTSINSLDEKPLHSERKYFPDRNIKAYMCQFCLKGYGNSNDLKHHLYSHRGERGFGMMERSRYMGTKEADPGF